MSGVSPPRSGLGLNLCYLLSGAMESACVRGAAQGSADSIQKHAQEFLTTDRAAMSATDAMAAAWTFGPPSVMRDTSERKVAREAVAG